jgi:transposase
MRSDEEWHELKMALAKAYGRITTLEKDVAFLKKDNEHLRKELRKYINENTPSGAIPFYLKETLQTAVEEPKEKKEPAENSRNARPKADRAEHHTLEACPGCGGRLSEKKKPRSRTIIHIEMPKASVVEHICHAYYCANCKKEVVPKVPGTLPNCKFDLATAILISYLFVAENMTTGGIAKYFSDVLGVWISKGSVCNSLARLKDYLGDEYAFLEQEIIKANARYRDETGHRKNGRLLYVWVVATAKEVIYRIENGRQHAYAQKIKGKRGVDISDGYKAYNRLETDKQRCWAHAIRVARNPEHPFALEQEIDDYTKLVQRLGKLYHQAKEKWKAGALSKALRKRYDKRLRKCLLKVRWHSKNSIKLVNYLMSYEGEWFTFLEHEGVEPTNNRAERALRHIVIKRKVSQQSRGDKSTESYAMQASLFMTARQNGQNYMEYLSDVVEDKIHADGKF